MKTRRNCGLWAQAPHAKLTHTGLPKGHVQFGGKLTYSHNDCGWHHFALDHEVADSDIEKSERVAFRMCGMHIDDATSWHGWAVLANKIAVQRITSKVSIKSYFRRRACAVFGDVPSTILDTARVCGSRRTAGCA
jgi:hypothetical protein